MRLPLILLSIAYCVQFSSQQMNTMLPEEIVKIINNCTELTKVDPEIKEKFLRSGQFVNDANLKCFIKCTGTSSGGLDDTGHLIIDKVRADYKGSELPDDKIDEIINVCSKKTGTDPCDTAFNIAKCLEEETIASFKDS